MNGSAEVTTTIMILVDAHVHFHSCFPPTAFVAAAAENLGSAAAALGADQHASGVLCLTESRDADWFGQLRLLADGEPGAAAIPGWSVAPTEESSSVMLTDGAERRLFVVAGRQIVTKERLEVLALCTAAAFEDGRPIEETIRSVQDVGGVAVLPWGFGKWLAGRGRIVERIIRTSDASLCLGDNSGRMRGWAPPREFADALKRGVRVLPGSDPLPFPGEYRKVGSYGFCIPTTLDSRRPARDLARILPRSEIRPFGKLETPHRFIINQLRMQLHNRVLA